MGSLPAPPMRSEMLERRLSKEERMRSMSSVTSLEVRRLWTMRWAVAITLSSPSAAAVAAVVVAISRVGIWREKGGEYGCGGFDDGDFTGFVGWFVSLDM